MIRLTDEQAIRLDRNIGEAMEDLRTAVFVDSEDATFLSVGANVGLALQKLHDIRVFLSEQAKKQQPAMANVGSIGDPWNEQLEDLSPQQASEIQDYLHTMLTNQRKAR